MLAIAVSLAAMAADFDWQIPDHPDRVPGECAQAVDLVPGQPLPDGLLDERGRIACRATVVPTSQLAELLLVDAWARQAAPRGRLLLTEHEWQEARYAALLDTRDRNTRKGQRTLGRVEGALGVALLVGLYVAVDAALEGGSQ